VSAIRRCTSCATLSCRANGPRPRGLRRRYTRREEVTHVREGDHVISTWVPRSPISGLPVSQPTGATFRGRDVIGDIADKVVPMSPSDPIDSSCLIGCAVLTGAGAVLHTARVESGQSVAVLGARGVALSAIGAAAIAGADPIIAVDLDDRKLQFCQGVRCYPWHQCLQYRRGRRDSGINPGGVDYTFAAVAVPTTALQILEAVKPGGPRADNQGGIAVLLGIPVSAVSVDLNTILLHQRPLLWKSRCHRPRYRFPALLGVDA
jgi:Zn-dependent alcohol dehydrogenase